MRILLRVLKIIGGVLLAIIALPVIYTLCLITLNSTVFSGMGKVAVDPAVIPDKFPVVVVTPGTGDSEWKAVTIYHKDLQEYLAQNPNHTFLIPKGAEKELREQVEALSTYSPVQPKDPWSTDFKIEKTSNGEQHIQASRVWDEDYENKGWYVATDTGFTPTQYQMNMLGGSFQSGIFSVPIAFILWIVGIVVVMRYKKKNVS